MKFFIIAATGVMCLLSLTGCHYQPAPMAPDPYTQSTFLGNDWPIGTGQPGQGENLNTLAGTVAEEE